MTAFFVSLAISSVLMGVLLLSDRRVLELRRARTEVADPRPPDRRAARSENEELKAAIEAANRHEFPAEKVAREELHLVAAGRRRPALPAGQPHEARAHARSPPSADPGRRPARSPR